MAIYKDSKTGAILVTDSVLGGDWELVEYEKKKKLQRRKMRPNSLLERGYYGKFRNNR
ncbi:TPA: hypothetical protein ACP1GB_000011 [Streptococcus pyogenes]